MGGFPPVKVSTSNGASTCASHSPRATKCSPFQVRREKPLTGAQVCIKALYLTSLSGFIFLSDEQDCLLTNKLPLAFRELFASTKPSDGHGATGLWNSLVLALSEKSDTAHNASYWQFYYNSSCFCRVLKRFCTNLSVHMSQQKQRSYQVFIFKAFMQFSVWVDSFQLCACMHTHTHTCWADGLWKCCWSTSILVHDLVNVVYQFIKLHYTSTR